MTFFVKFVRYDERTISALINKTIKFSTVLEFNDFSEIDYYPAVTRCWKSIIAGKKDFSEDQINSFKIMILKIISTLKYPKFRADILKNTNWIRNFYSEKEYDNFISKIENYSEKEYNDFLSKIENYKTMSHNDVKFLEILEKYTAFLSVGIFCLSYLDIFDNDNLSANLMFAHYADSLKGLALIYEKLEKPDLIEVKYSTPLKPTGPTPKELMEWFKNAYSDLEPRILDMNYPTANFIQKYSAWDYENEYRLFTKPQIVLSEKYIIYLRSILYTSRLPKEEIETLEEINNAHYEGKIVLQKVFSSLGKFYAELNTGPVPVKEWLERLNVSDLYST